MTDLPLTSEQNKTKVVVIFPKTLHKSRLFCGFWVPRGIASEIDAFDINKSCSSLKEQKLLFKAKIDKIKNKSSRAMRMLSTLVF